MARKLEDILASHGCDFRSSGRFEILTRCPLCGDADPSEHLAISTRKRGWRCLRNPHQHRGRSYVRLLTLLLRCSPERAKELLGIDDTVPLPDEDDFATQWRAQLGIEDTLVKPKSLQFPKEFRQLTPGASRSRGFWLYLSDRGFSPEQGFWASEAYDLHYALSGKYAYRVIVPIYDRNNQLMTWTARSIRSDADIRYMTLGKENARKPPGELLLGLPLLWKARKRRCLVVCEGPFDAIAVSVIGHEAGVWGTCLFGLELSTAQADILTDVGEGFDRMRVALDPDASLRVLSLRSQLPRRCLPLHLPERFKDPGQLIGSRTGEDFVLSLAQ